MDEVDDDTKTSIVTISLNFDTEYGFREKYFCGNAVDNQSCSQLRCFPSCNIQHERQHFCGRPITATVEVFVHKNDSSSKTSRNVDIDIHGKARTAINASGSINSDDELCNVKLIAEFRMLTEDSKVGHEISVEELKNSIVRQPIDTSSSSDSSGSSSTGSDGNTFFLGKCIRANKPLHVEDGTLYTSSMMFNSECKAWIFPNNINTGCRYVVTVSALIPQFILCDSADVKASFKTIAQFDTPSFIIDSLAAISQYKPYDICHNSYYNLNGSEYMDEHSREIVGQIEVMSLDRAQSSEIIGTNPEKIDVEKKAESEKHSSYRIKKARNDMWTLSQLHLKINRKRIASDALVTKLMLSKLIDISNADTSTADSSCLAPIGNSDSNVVQINSGNSQKGSSDDSIFNQFYASLNIPAVDIPDGSTLSSLVETHYFMYQPDIDDNCALALLSLVTDYTFTEDRDKLNPETKKNLLNPSKKKLYEAAPPPSKVIVNKVPVIKIDGLQPVFDVENPLFRIGDRVWALIFTETDESNLVSSTYYTGEILAYGGEGNQHVQIKFSSVGVYDFRDDVLRVVWIPLSAIESVVHTGERRNRKKKKRRDFENENNLQKQVSQLQQQQVQQYQQVQQQQVQFSSNEHIGEQYRQSQVPVPYYNLPMQSATGTLPFNQAQYSSIQFNQQDQYNTSQYIDGSYSLIANQYTNSIQYNQGVPVPFANQYAPIQYSSSMQLAIDANGQYIQMPYCADSTAAATATAAQYNAFQLQQRQQQPYQESPINHNSNN